MKLASFLLLALVIVCVVAAAIFWVRYLPPLEDGDDLEGDE